MNDEGAINYITKLKGLGIWSAEMFLMFNLNRRNIFPTKRYWICFEQFQKITKHLIHQAKNF